MTDHTEYKLARTLVEAHTAPEVAPIVLEAVDKWAAEVTAAKEALAAAPIAVGGHYTVRQVCTLFGTSDDHVRRLIDSGDLPAFRTGGAVRIPCADAHDYVAKHTTRNAPPAPKPRASRRPQDELDTINQYPFLAS